MAIYRDKYQASFNYPDGSTLTLTIKQKGWTGSTYGIAEIQGLSLEVGGGNEPIYTPIVKTTLKLSIPDCFDIGTTVGGIQCVTRVGNQYVKHGQWEEFYTRDATKYLVVLSWSGSPVRDGIIWQGYVTPDSWAESMIYRGTITIVARDMLGVLSDLDFDSQGTEGLISVGDLIRLSLAKCQAPMSLTFGQALRNISEDFSIFAACVDVRAFKGRTWWNALTDTLEALGLVLRYNGNGGWTAASLRYLPDILSQENHGCEFINRSGLRTLDPPVKEIAGEFHLDIETSPIQPLASSDLRQYGTIPTLFWDDEHNAYNQGSATAYELGTSSGDWASAPGSATRPPLFVKPLAPGMNIAISEQPYFIANTGEKLVIGTRKNYGVAKVTSGIFTAPCRLVVEQAGDIVQKIGNNFILPFQLNPEKVKLDEVLLYIKKSNGQYYQGNGQWATGVEKSSDKDTTANALDPLRLSFSKGQNFIDIYPPSGSNRIALEINIVYVGIVGYTNPLNPSLYVPLLLSVAENASSGLADEYGVKTIYNEDYNVRIDRTPAIGSIDTPLPGRIFKNALQTNTHRVIPDVWNWAGNNSGYPLEVMVQAQLLQFYSDSLSIFTGDLHDTTTKVAIPGSSYTYFSRHCVSLRGTYDFTTGFIQGCALREYRTWEQVWGNFDPDYSIDKERSRSGGGGSGGGGYSGGGGGGGTRVTWGEETEANYSLLNVGGDSRQVAMVNHKHSSNNFTQEQWNAITSGIDSDDKTKLEELPNSVELGEIIDGLMSRTDDDPVSRNITPASDVTYDLGSGGNNGKCWRNLHIKRIYLDVPAGVTVSTQPYIEIGSDGAAHLYGADLVVENGDVASAG